MAVARRARRGGVAPLGLRRPRSRWASSSPVLTQIPAARGSSVVGTAASMPPLNMTTKTGGVVKSIEESIPARAMAEAMG